MEFRSSYFSAHMGTSCRDIPTVAMTEMITELSVNAIFVMSTEIENSITARVAATIVDVLKSEKYKFMPLYLVCEGFTKGSLGELGGTTRFSVRNVFVWMNAMYMKLAEINAAQKSKEDAERRAEEARSFKSRQRLSNLYGAAMYRKMEWAHAGAITSADYDRLTLDKIVDALRKGYSIKELQPSMIL